jgi:hypothetical protein
MQLVHTSMRLAWPFLSARTVCRLGLKRRLLILCAWLTLLPTIGFLPQISHCLDIFRVPFDRILSMLHKTLEYKLTNFVCKGFYLHAAMTRLAAECIRPSVMDRG